MGVTEHHRRTRHGGQIGRATFRIAPQRVTAFHPPRQPESQLASGGLLAHVSSPPPLRPGGEASFPPQDTDTATGGPATPWKSGRWGLTTSRGEKVPRANELTSLPASRVAG